MSETASSASQVPPPGSGSPDGSAGPGSAESAAGAWRSLDSGKRREVRRAARRMRPHPDPGVGAVAARYAREELARVPPRRFVVDLFQSLVPIACMLAVIALITAQPAGPVSLTRLVLIWVLAVAAIIAGIIMEVRLLIRLRRRRQVRVLLRIEAANRLALPAPVAQPATPAAWWEPGPVNPVAIRYDKSRIVAVAGRAALLPAAAVIACAIMAIGFTGPIRVLLLSLMSVVTLLLLVFAGLSAHTLIRWALPGRAVIAMDADGLHFAAISCHLPWAELTEIRLFPIRFSERTPVPPGTPVPQGPSAPARPGQLAGKSIIAFVPARPDEVFAALRLSWIRRSSGRRALQLYGTNLVITDRLLDHAAEQIVATAARFAPVQVRRYH